MRFMRSSFVFGRELTAVLVMSFLASTRLYPGAIQEFAPPGKKALSAPETEEFVPVKKPVKSPKNAAKGAKSPAVGKKKGAAGNNASPENAEADSDTQEYLPNTIAPEGNSDVGEAPIHGKSNFEFVIIDAGHGGKDSGALGRRRVIEKHIALRVAGLLYTELKSRRPDIKIYLTRKKDVFVTLEGRTQIANGKFGQARNGLFVSLHCNSARAAGTTGFEIYHLSDRNDTIEARRLAAIENKYLLPKDGGRYIKKMESAMLLGQVQRESIRLASMVNASMRRTLAGDSRSRGVKSANLHVLRGSLMPAVLIEMGFISNQGEAGLIATAEYQEKLAKAIAVGVESFIASPEYKPH